MQQTEPQSATLGYSPSGAQPPLPRNRSAAVQRPYLTLDAWRGAACLGVLCFHASLLAVRSWRFSQPAGQIRIPLVYRWAGLGYLGVEIFFVISGYCIVAAAVSGLRRNATWRAFARARIQRIFPTYWIALALTLCNVEVTKMLVLRGYLHESQSAMASFGNGWTWLGNLALIQGYIHQPSWVAVAWSLCYEIAFYAIVCILLASQRWFRGSILLPLHALTVFTIGLIMCWPGRVIAPFELWPLFGLGILAYDLNTNGWNRRTVGASVMIVAPLLALVLLYTDWVGPMVPAGKLAFAVGLTFTFLIVAMFRYDGSLAKRFVVRGLIKVGGISYSLYLIHFLVLGAVAQLFRRLPQFGSLHSLQFVISLIIAVGTAGLFFRFAERPFLARSTRRMHDLVQTAADQAMVSPQLASGT